MSKILEALTERLHRDVFLREFSFPASQFIDSSNSTKEFADHVVWIDRTLLLFQVKHRQVDQAQNADAENRWFDDKVRKEGSRQIRKTLSMLRDEPEIPLKNQAGRSTTLRFDQVSDIYSIVLYAPRSVPRKGLAKIHISRTVGPIHLVSWNDYLRLCELLETPTELIEYLAFRAKVLADFSAANPGRGWPSEKALAGQFLTGQENQPASETYASAVDLLKAPDVDFRLTSFLGQLGGKVDYSTGRRVGQSDAHYKILTEFARLHRIALSHVKKRLLLVLDGARRADTDPIVSRIAIPSTGCGFVFLALPAALSATRIRGLENFTLITKYALKVERQVGVCMVGDGDEVDVTWMYRAGPWEYRPDMEEQVAKMDQYVPVREIRAERYRFR